MKALELLDDVTDPELVGEMAQEIDQGRSMTSVAPSSDKEARFLSPKQTAWARAFVVSGNATEAARYAEYGNIHVSGQKNLYHPQVMKEVKRLAILNMESHLPKAIARIVGIIEDPETPASLALDASFKLIERVIGKQKTSPLIAIQNNTTTVNAQDVIADVWKERTKRLSDISTSMSDISPNVDQDDQDAQEEG